MWLFIFFFVWLRGSLPRVRYDQFMKLGWKLLIPATLVWVLCVAFIRAAQLGFLGDGRVALFGRDFAKATLFVIGSVIALVLVLAWVWDARQTRRARARRPEPPAQVDPFAGGYPVPPLPGQRLVEPRPALVTAGATSGTVVGRHTARGASGSGSSAVTGDPTDTRTVTGTEEIRG